MQVDPVDVLVLTALKEELDALLEVRTAFRQPWNLSGGDPPLHRAVLDGLRGPVCVAATRLTKMGGVATASLAARSATPPGTRDSALGLRLARDQDQ